MRDQVPSSPFSNNERFNGLNKVNKSVMQQQDIHHYKEKEEKINYQNCTAEFCDDSSFVAANITQGSSYLVNDTENSPLMKHENDEITTAIFSNIQSQTFLNEDILAGYIPPQSTLITCSYANRQPDQEYDRVNNQLKDKKKKEIAESSLKHLSFCKHRIQKLIKNDSIEESDKFNKVNRDQNDTNSYPHQYNLKNPQSEESDVGRNTTAFNKQIQQNDLPNDENYLYTSKSCNQSQIAQRVKASSPIQSQKSLQYCGIPPTLNQMIATPSQSIQQPINFSSSTFSPSNQQENNNFTMPTSSSLNHFSIFSLNTALPFTSSQKDQKIHSVPNIFIKQDSSLNASMQKIVMVFPPQNLEPNFNGPKGEDILSSNEREIISTPPQIVPREPAKTMNQTQIAQSQLEPIISISSASITPCFDGQSYQQSYLYQFTYKQESPSNNNCINFNKFKIQESTTIPTAHAPKASPQYLKFYTEDGYDKTTQQMNDTGALIILEETQLLLLPSQNQKLEEQIKSSKSIENKRISFDVKNDKNDIIYQNNQLQEQNGHEIQSKKLLNEMVKSQHNCDSSNQRQYIPYSISSQQQSSEISSYSSLNAIQNNFLSQHVQTPNCQEQIASIENTCFINKHQQEIYPISQHFDKVPTKVHANKLSQKDIPINISEMIDNSNNNNYYYNHIQTQQRSSNNFSQVASPSNVSCSLNTFQGNQNMEKFHSHKQQEGNNEVGKQIVPQKKQSTNKIASNYQPQGNNKRSNGFYSPIKCHQLISQRCELTRNKEISNSRNKVGKINNNSSSNNFNGCKKEDSNLTNQKSTSLMTRSSGFLKMNQNERANQRNCFKKILLIPESSLTGKSQISSPETINKPIISQYQNIIAFNSNEKDAVIQNKNHIFNEPKPIFIPPFSSPQELKPLSLQVQTIQKQVSFGPNISPKNLIQSSSQKFNQNMKQRNSLKNQQKQVTISLLNPSQTQEISLKQGQVSLKKVSIITTDHSKQQERKAINANKEQNYLSFSIQNLKRRQLQ